MEKRHARIKELLEECDLTTGNAIIDTLFAFFENPYGGKFIQNV